MLISIIKKSKRMNMKRLVLIIVPALICGIVFTGCGSNKEVGIPENNNSLLIEATDIEMNLLCCSCGNDITSVKAKIYNWISDTDDGEYHWVIYEVASARFENGEFKLNFSETVPDEYLLFNNSIQAKTGIVSIDAYSSTGLHCGSFELYDRECSVEYMYSDRDFIENGNRFKKGWNIVYAVYGDYENRTAQKPVNGNFKWYFAEICLHY